MSNQNTIWRSGSRCHLLATVSTFALLASGASIDSASASGASTPPIWIEIGLHTDQVNDSKDGFALPFGDLIPQSGLTGPLVGVTNLSRSYGDDARVTFRPDETDWVFSASVRYGRAHGKGHVHQSKAFPSTTFLAFHSTIPTYPFPWHASVHKPLKEKAAWVDADTVSAESHYTVDFSVGRDVGLGMFGHGSQSTVNIGVRFAQFRNALNVSQFHAKPDVHFSHFQSTFPTLAFFPSGVKTVPWYFSGYRQVWHNLAGNPHSSHSFAGIGPSLSWEASAPLWGNPDQEGLSVDWSVNAAILFGKQKNEVHHETVGTSECYGYVNWWARGCPVPQPYENVSTQRNTKNVSVPDVGGSVGISYRLHDVKMSAGYRADYFFHVLETGFAGQGTITRGFIGPYASISVGIGG